MLESGPQYRGTAEWGRKGLSSQMCNLNFSNNYSSKKFMLIRISPHFEAEMTNICWLLKCEYVTLREESQDFIQSQISLMGWTFY